VTVPGGDGQASMAQGGRLTVVGIGGGVVEWSFFGMPYESTITNTYWGTIEDLYEVVAMYQLGQIRPEVERFGMDQALEAYRRLPPGPRDLRAGVRPQPRRGLSSTASLAWGRHSRLKIASSY
jgi:alcohol dehydrogenase, propanol-preferring